MADVIETREPAGTHTVERRWTETETPKQVAGMKQTAQPKLWEWDVLGSQVGIRWFVSGAKEYSTAPSGAEAFLVLSPRDQADAIFEAPGADLWARLWRALPVLALVAPGEEFLSPEVVERLLNCDVPIAPQRVRHSASTQVELSVDKWMIEVRAWASSHPQTDHVVDDSRGSIYGDRG